MIRGLLTRSAGNLHHVFEMLKAILPNESPDHVQVGLEPAVLVHGGATLASRALRYEGDFFCQRARLMRSICGQGFVAAKITLSRRPETDKRSNTPYQTAAECAGQVSKEV